MEEEQEKLGGHFWVLETFDLGVLPTRQASYSSLLILFQLWEFILWLEFPLMLKNSFSICKDPVAATFPRGSYLGIGGRYETASSPVVRLIRYKIGGPNFFKGGEIVGTRVRFCML